MTARTFSLLVAALMAAYSFGCFVWFNQPFQGFTSAILGVLVSLIPLYLESDRSTALDTAQVAQFMHDSLPRAAGDVVHEILLRQIRERLIGITQGRVELSFEELGRYAEHRLRQAAVERPPGSYWVTHIVDSNDSCGLWSSDDNKYPWFRSYVAAQRALLDAGGSVTRLFLFSPEWLHNNLVATAELLRAHDLLFAGSVTPILTLATDLTVASQADHQELSVLSSHDVFVWNRSRPGRGEPFSGGVYVTDRQTVAAAADSWRRLAANAMTASAFVAAERRSRS